MQRRNPNTHKEITMIAKPYCFTCKHFDKAQGNCTAFPKGIPFLILANLYDHREAYKGDNGIQYEPTADAPAYMRKPITDEQRRANKVAEDNDQLKL